VGGRRPPHLIFAQSVSESAVRLAWELVQVMPQKLMKFIDRCFESDQFVGSIALEQCGGEFTGLGYRTFI
jgi:hypothetical protein